jgi:hypothetical protein
MAAYLILGPAGKKKKKGNDAIVKVAHEKCNKGRRHLFSKQKKKKRLSTTSRPTTET